MSIETEFSPREEKYKASMSREPEIAPLTVLTGHYGCGKTNLAVNLALLLSGRGRVSIVDFDTVNPYFRTADFTKMLEENGIKVFYPRYAGTNLDIPVLNFDVESIIAESDFTIIDLGGSDAGALPIKRYGRLFERLGAEIIYVFNMYRLIDNSVEETAGTMREIERAAGICCTALVNNSNLGSETTPQTIEKSAAFAKRLGEETGLPLVFTCVSENERGGKTRLPVRRLVTLPWEKDTENGEQK